jgi:small conductance mechanosensitive channel
MNRSARHWKWILVFVCAAAIGLPWTAPAVAQESGSTAVTAAEPEIALDELKLLLDPLTKAELEIEAQAWMALLQQKVQQITDVEIAVKHKSREIKSAEEVAEAAEEAKEQLEEAEPAATKQAPDAPAVAADVEQLDQQAEAAEQVAEEKAEVKAELLDNVTELRSQRTALIDRATVVLNAWEKKGGDPAEHRLYVAAVSGIRVDVSDTSAAWATIVGWLKSPEGGVRWAKRIGAFLVILLAFWILALIVGRVTDRAMRMSKRLSSLIRDFVATSVRRIVLIIGVVVAIGALGVKVGPVLAVIGAAGFVVAFALQDALGNLASGIMILVYRPFDVGDAVDVGGVSGKVHSMNLVSTTIRTFDNKVVVVPNNKIWGDVITNITGSSQRRVDMIFGIAYDADIAQAQAIQERILEAHPLVLKDPEPVVKVHELADSSVNFVCRPWTKTDDYWTVYWDVTRAVKEQFDEADISIPFPQRDVHVHQVAAPATAT